MNRAILLVAALTIANEGANFLGTLTQPQQRRVTFAFDDAERKNWSYVPGTRRGLALGEMNAKQKDALDALLRVALSPQGHSKARGVIELEPILGQIEGNSFRDPGRYFVTMFRDPKHDRWGWRLEGHHLSLNYTVTPEGTSATPEFFGANPANAPSGKRLLHDEEDLGRQLVRSLNDVQRARAILNVRAPADIITGNDREVHLRAFEGIPASALTPDQRALLVKLLHVYIDNANAATAAREWARLDPEKLYFAWAGSMEPRKGHYYRIHGPTILIEYDNTQNGANHIHSVWRSPDNDWGEDLLRKHYAKHHH